MYYKFCQNSCSSYSWLPLFVWSPCSQCICCNSLQGSWHHGTNVFGATPVLFVDSLSMVHADDIINFCSLFVPGTLISLCHNLSIHYKQHVPRMSDITSTNVDNIHFFALPFAVFQPLMNLPLAHRFFTVINCHWIYFTSFHNHWLQTASHIPFLFFGTFHKLRVTAEHVHRVLHVREYTYWLYPSLFLIIFSVLGWCLTEELYAILKKNHVSQYSLVLDRLDEIVCESWRENCHFNYCGYSSC